MRSAKTYWPYLALSLLILGPLLLPGYILTMDMVFVPHPPLPTEINASYPFYFVLHFLSYIVPGDVLQKLVLLVILSLCGIGMHRLLRHEFPKLSVWAVYAASIFYAVNPFVYERLMMGQFAVVGGYALLPFFVVSFQRLLRGLEWKQLARTVAWLLAISIISIHSLVPAAILAVFIWLAALWQHRGTRFWWLSLKRLAIGSAALLLLSLYWLLPAVLGHGTAGSALHASAGDAAFTTQGNIFTILRLEGFWAEGRGLFTPAHYAVTIPILWQLAVWAGVVAGAIRLWHQHRPLFLIYIAVIVVGTLLAFVGLPFLGEAYREPHKFTMLVAVGLTVCAAVGADTLVRRFKFVASLIIVIPLLLSPAMLWGFSGQLSARAYPPEWYALNEKLRTLPDNEPTIFVPWHLYQRFSFSPRIVANPAATFFDRNVLVSNDPEFAGTDALKPDARKQQVGELLRTHPADLANRLGRLGIGYVIFAKEPGHEDVEFVRHAPGLQQIFSQGSLELYRVMGGRP